MTFGEKLKCARKEAGLSQEQLAEKLSVSRSAVAKWESDKGMPDVIYALISNRKMSKAEWLIDFFVQPGVVEVLDRMNGNNGYYLVEKGNRQYFVKVTKDFITTSVLPNRVDGKRFVIGKHQYTKAYQIV